MTRYVRSQTLPEHPVTIRPVNRKGPAVSVVNTRPIRDECENTAPAPCTCELSIESGPAGNIVVLRVSGEIDLLTIPTVGDALGEAMDQASAGIVIDLTAVGFCCVRGFTLLAATARAAHSDGIGFAVSGMTPHLHRVASILWPARRCVRYRSAAAAVTAIRIDQADRPA